MVKIVLCHWHTMTREDDGHSDAWTHSVARPTHHHRGRPSLEGLYTSLLGPTVSSDAKASPQCHHRETPNQVSNLEGGTGDRKLVYNRSFALLLRICSSSKALIPISRLLSGTVQCQYISGSIWLKKVYLGFRIALLFIDGNSATRSKRVVCSILTWFCSYRSTFANEF